MSLGRTKGVVWIGRPLDLAVQVRLDQGEDASTLCLAVDVLYADNRVNTGQVRVFVEPGGTREETTLRIQSSVPVDEPVVNIYLKAGCAQAMTRRYVLLAEVPVDYRADSMAPANRAGAPFAALQRRDDAPAAAVESAATAGSMASGRSASKPAWAGGGAAPQQGGPAAVSAAIRPAPVRSVVRKPVAETVSPKARLKLDPADLLIERDPVLRVSTELLSQPEEGGTRRAEALAMWRAINASPQEIIREAQRLQALQTDVSALRGQNQKQQAEIADLKVQVQLAQSERFSRSLVYGLVAALIAVLGVAGYFWRRQRSQSGREWWNQGQEHSVSAEPELAERAGGGQMAVTPPAGLDIDLSAASVPPGEAAPVARQGSAAPSGLSALDSVDFQTSLTGAGRAVKVEELLDIQQQADFFISLGQYEQAVATLRNHISDNVETSALAYLDLLKIYHLQGREKDYALVRKEFNDVFNAAVPEFSAFGEQTRGLEAYQSALSRITALWPTPKALDVIEESIFRKPGQGSQVFDLQAYRELLMLYAVAKEIVEDARPGQGLVPPGKQSTGSPGNPSPAGVWPERNRPDFQSTNIQPLPVASMPSERYGDSHSMPLLRVPPSPNLGLDIDLSELEPVPVVPPVEPLQKKAMEPKAPDSHLIDFDLFDMATQAHAASKRGKP